VCDWYKDKGEEEEIERIEGPPEETSDESIALCAVQRFEEPDRFHAESTKCYVERSRDISQGSSYRLRRDSIAHAVVLVELRSGGWHNPPHKIWEQQRRDQSQVKTLRSIPH